MVRSPTAHLVVPIVGEADARATATALEAYDTVCVGATRSGPVSQAVFGSLPERIGEEAEGTVVMARGPEESPLSLGEAIARRPEV